MTVFMFCWSISNCPGFGVSCCSVGVSCSVLLSLLLCGLSCLFLLSAVLSQSAVSCQPCNLELNTLFLSFEVSSTIIFRIAL